MTLRLYYTDSYLRDFDATVVERADDGRRIYLDRTAFYPTSGGQPFDTGTLGGIAVVDVVDEGERVAHLLADPLAGDRVQRHASTGTAASTTCSSTPASTCSPPCSPSCCGHATIGVHFGSESSTLDLDAPAHRSRAPGRGRVPGQPAGGGESSGRGELRGGRRRERASQGVGPGGNPAHRDHSAIWTGAPAAALTCARPGRSGPILIRKAERVKKNVRLEFVCGARAVRRARADLDLLARLAAQFSAAPAELPALVEAQRAELKEAVAARRELEDELWPSVRARDLYAAAPPDGSGLRCDRGARGEGSDRAAAPAWRKPSPGCLGRCSWGGRRSRPRSWSPRRPTRSWTRAACSGQRWNRWEGVAEAMRGWLRVPRPSAAALEAGGGRDRPRPGLVQLGRQRLDRRGAERGARLAAQDRERLVPRQSRAGRVGRR